MGYRAEKLNVERKEKLLKRILLCILLACLLGLCIFSAFVPPSSWKYRVSLPNVSKRMDGELRIHFLDVGQGDATLIELPDGKVVLIDGGDGSGAAKRTLIRYINALKIKKIDHLIVTHADRDHCGGLQTLLQQKKVRNAYLPPKFSMSETAYAKFYATLLKTDTIRNYSSRSLGNLGQATIETEYAYNFCFLYPDSMLVDGVINGETEIIEDNEMSSVVWLEYQGVSAVFMGDAPADIETRLMTEDELGVFSSLGVRLTDTDVIKVSHHGSGSSTTAEFLKYIGAKDGIISCGVDNTYGHPAAETLERLAAAGVNVHRTDTEGTVMITITTDGKYTIEKSGK